MDFSLTQLDDANSLSIAFKGLMNEDAEVTFQTLLPKIAEVKQVTFNFAEIKSINSLGVRSWVQFLRAIGEGRTIFFEHCVPDVIMQINMIPSFLASAQIVSFYTNYICANCPSNAGTKRILVERASLAPKSAPEPRSCETCGNVMETEELEEEYFSFLLR